MLAKLLTEFNFLKLSYTWCDSNKSYVSKCSITCDQNPSVLSSYHIYLQEIMIFMFTIGNRRISLTTIVEVRNRG